MSAADPTEDYAERQAILTVLRMLPEQQRAVAILRLWEGFSVAQTAAQLGIAEGTVKSYTSRAVNRLRDLLAQPTEAS